MQDYNKRTIDKAVSNAIASVKMEGYTFSDRNKKLCEAVVLGNMTKKECIEKLLSDRV